MNSNLEVIPLGGLGEFGMNCCALRYGDEMILVDAGITFPGGNLNGLGIDLIVPDLEFLRGNADQLRAILLTHGHEDHAGAVSYVLREVDAPVYGSALTMGLVEQRIAERGLKGRRLERIEARQKLEFGPFQVEPLHLTHSFPDSFAFAVTTPVGCLIWTGDFKFDQTPIDQKPSDMGRLAEYGERGVLALFSDSTNSDVPGLAPSEFSVIEPLRTLFRKAERKIVASCFASSIHRIQILVDLAQEFDRKIVAAGRSIVSNIRVSRELGYLRAPQELFISPGESAQFPPDKVLVVATGSQGEPMSALSRMAVNEFKSIPIEEDDLVVLSARIIPGNERLISNLVNHFCRRGADVYDSRNFGVHASGHGYAADLKLMLNLTKPRFFVPIHGEYRQLAGHVRLAVEQGVVENNVRLIETGDILELSSKGARVTGKAPVGRRFIDEGHREEVDEVVVRDRRFLSEDGFLVVVLRLDRFSGELIGEPELVSRGFVLMETSAELMDETRQQILQVVAETPAEEKQDEEVFKEILRTRRMRFLRKKTGKRPVIIPLTLEF